MTVMPLGSPSSLHNVIKLNSLHDNKHYDEFLKIILELRNNSRNLETQHF